MAAQQLLRNGQAEAGSFRTTGNQRVKNRVLQRQGNARPVVLDVDAYYCAVPHVADGKVHQSPASQRNLSVPIEGRRSILHEVQKRLHHLVAVEVDQRQAHIVIATEANVFADIRLNQTHDVLEQLVHIQRLLVRRASGAKQSIDECRQPVRFADDDIGVFPEFVAVELPRQQLRGAAQAAQRVLDFVRKLPNHLAAGAMLNDQRVLPAYFRAPRYVIHFDEQRILEPGRCHRRNAAIDDTILGVCLVPAETKFIGMWHAGYQRAHQHIAHFRVIIDERQQRMADSAGKTDSQQVLRGRIEFDDKEIVVKQDDGGSQAIDDIFRALRVSVSALPAGLQLAIAFCCTWKRLGSLRIISLPV